MFLCWNEPASGSSTAAQDEAQQQEEQHDEPVARCGASQVERVARTSLWRPPWTKLDWPSSSSSATSSEAARPSERHGDRLDEESYDLLLREVRGLLTASVHQLNSPLSAVRTLSKLLLRRLDGSSEDTMSRELARDILIQAERLSELIQPIDRLAVSLPASEYSSDASGASLLPDDVDDDGVVNTGDAEELTISTTVDLRRNKRAQAIVPPPPVAPFFLGASASPSLGTAAAAEAALPAGISLGTDAAADGDDDEGYSICFVGDVLRPIAMLAANLAPEHDVDHVFVSIDPEDDTRCPGARGAIREATTNLVDNALKYCCRVGGDSRRRGSGAAPGDRLRLESRAVDGVIEVWNSCLSSTPMSLCRCSSGASGEVLQTELTAPV